MNDTVTLEVTHEVRDRCLCLYVQRAARALARRFDEAFKDLDLTNGQFSLLMSLNVPVAPSISRVASILAMDRTTLTAAIKPLERRGLVKVLPDPEDKRSRRLTITRKGKALLARALPIWRREHDAIDQLLSGSDPERLRQDLRALV